mgnify:CR=1 FL=1
MKKNKVLILLNLIIFFLGCKNESILPNDFELNKVNSFYCGVYKTEIFIIENKTPSLDDLVELPNFKIKLEVDRQSYKWELMNVDSDIFKSLIYELNSSFSISKNDTERKKWIKTFLLELKEKKEGFYISGIYSKIVFNQSDFNYNFHNYYLLNIEKSKLIKLTKVSL